MPKNHARKNANRRRQQRTGASYTSAAAGTAHTHTPLPDLTELAASPFAAGRQLDLDLAARLVAACRSGCMPCQRKLAAKLREQRPTVAALAGAVYGAGLAARFPGAIASDTTRAWAPVARAAVAGGDASEALAAVEAMPPEQLSELLEDTLDHWAGGAPLPADLLEKDPSEALAGVFDQLREAGVQVFGPDDFGIDLDDDDVDDAPCYGVFVGTTAMPDGRPLPMLTLYPETAGAGPVDLKRRTGWRPWDLRDLPELDFHWRLRVDIATRSLRELVHTDIEGGDDLRLWEASERVTLPEPWWDLLDRAQHVLVTGPAEDGTNDALAAAASAGELLAVIARVSFA